MSEAIERPGLRMVVVSNIPSPWSEAAKGIFHIEKIQWTATRLAYDDPALPKWIGSITAPAVVLDDEAPRTGWAEILLLAERLAESPSLLPSDPLERATMMGLSHELMGVGGLCWARRLQGVHAGLTGKGGFGARVSGYLAQKYGYRPDEADAIRGRVASLLSMFADRLASSSGAYVMGDAVTAVDVYLAVTLALFDPLPPEQCDMLPKYREAYSSLDDETKAALSPGLLAFRDRMYAEHLELPLSL
ncbi:MAG: glutathione S-transferase C-terminal domain-containing protein [Nannocystaceae bacterium]